jgi:hypothetical protein
MFLFDLMCSALGKALARYLAKPDPLYRPLAILDPDKLIAALRPGDVLLVEGNTRISTAIKYLTQSTWSHAALYVGPLPQLASDRGEPRVLIEADVVKGVWAVPLGAYAGMHTRICRPVGLSAEELRKVVGFMVDSLGKQYDLRNVVDLARYLLPVPPVPTRLRHKLLYFGSGEPTKAICSTLIAQAFQSVRYPILPIRTGRPERAGSKGGVTLKMRHYSLFVPRDFDISPYFEIVKPTLDDKFDFHVLKWTDAPVPDAALPAPDDGVGARPRVTGHLPD